MSDDPQTRILLRRWHEGDAAALDVLLRENLPWIRVYVEQRLGPLLKRRGDTSDYVQEAMCDVLRYGPRFLLPDREQFRALVARIVLNVLHDEHDYHAAMQRDPRRERSAGLIDFEAAASATSPSAAAARTETQDLVRLAIDLLAPEDRKVLLAREWDGLSFGEVGAQLGMSEDAARMRFQRALPRLAQCVERLRRGDVQGALAEPDHA